MGLKDLTLPQRILSGVGCVVVLAALAIGALLVLWERRARLDLTNDLADPPAGWADSVRAVARFPDVGDLALSQDDSADGAWAVHDSARAYRRAGIDHGYRAIVGSERPNDSDSALWRAVAEDSALDDYARAARAGRWRSAERMLAPLDSSRRRNLMLLPVPMYGSVRDAGRALVIRALMRQERGDAAGARADLAAAVGLGGQLVRHEPTYIGLMVGRTIAASALHGWERYAAHTGDTTLARRVLPLLEWARGRPGTYARYLLAQPDSAVAIARDTTLPAGLRLFAVEQALAASLLRPRGLLVGPPRSVRRAIADLTRDADPNVAPIAVVADATARRINLFGFVGLVREWR